MATELFDERGPEANNRRAAEFETQLEGMAATLGWAAVCHNVDVVIKPAGRNPSRGIDVLWAFENPQTGDKDGVLGEAKVHGKQQGLSKLQDELQTLHDKMGDFARRQAFTNHEYIRDCVDGLRWGLLAHKTQPWDPGSAGDLLRSVKLKNLHGSVHVTTLLFVAPDTLNALADCVLLRHDGEELRPNEFYWPAHEDADAVWDRACPPHQLAAGMLAYKTPQGRTVLWLRDTLDVADMSALKDIAFAWKIDPDVVVFSELTSEAWGLLRTPWSKAAEDTASRRAGRLPPSSRVYARSLKPYANMNRFDDAWPIQENR